MLPRGGRRRGSGGPGRSAGPAPPERSAACGGAGPGHRGPCAEGEDTLGIAARGLWPNIDSSLRAPGSHWAESEARSRGSGRTDPHFPKGTSDGPLRAPAHRPAGQLRPPRPPPRSRSDGSAVPRPPRRGPPAKGRSSGRSGPPPAPPRSPPPGVTAGCQTAALRPRLSAARAAGCAPPGRAGLRAPSGALLRSHRAGEVCGAAASPWSSPFPVSPARQPSHALTVKASALSGSPLSRWWLFPVRLIIICWDRKSRCLLKGFRQCRSAQPPLPSAQRAFCSFLPTPVVRDQTATSLAWEKLGLEPRAWL